MLIVIELIIGVTLVVVWGYKDLTRELSQRPCQAPAEPDDEDGDDDAGDPWFAACGSRAKQVLSDGDERRTRSATALMRASELTRANELTRIEF